MAIASAAAPKAVASKLINISAPSLRNLLRPSPATHFFQSPTTATTSAADAQPFNLLQSENESTDSPRLLNLREIGTFALKPQPSSGYSAVRVELAEKYAPPSDLSDEGGDDDFGDGDDEYIGGLEDFEDLNDEDDDEEETEDDDDD